MRADSHGLAAGGYSLPAVESRVQPAQTGVAQRSPLTTTAATKAFLAVTAAALLAGWLVRDEEYLTAKEGIGYGLGVTGGVLLLLQFLYPLRKKLRFMRSWGEVRLWFGMHQLLGIVAPVIILFHSNFRLHAINSNVALFYMVVVAVSGLIGRHIHLKIRYRLHGRQVSLAMLENRVCLAKGAVEETHSISPWLKDRLRQWHYAELAPARGLVHGTWRAFSLQPRSFLMRRSLLREVARRGDYASSDDGKGRLERDRRLVSDYLGAVRQVLSYRVFSRLFALWHVLHIPLFFLMLLSGIVHVIAVHMY